MALKRGTIVLALAALVLVGCERAPGIVGNSAGALTPDKAKHAPYNCKDWKWGLWIVSTVEEVNPITGDHILVKNNHYLCVDEATVNKYPSGVSYP